MTIHKEIKKKELQRVKVLERIISAIFLLVVSLPDPRRNAYKNESKEDSSLDYFRRQNKKLLHNL
jgi:hypothetical protein